MNPIDWLLEDDAPPVAYLARRDLLDEDPDSRRMRSLARRANDYPPTARILDTVDRAIRQPPYKKYTGAYWTLLLLADLHAHPRHEAIRRLADHVLDTQLETAGFAPNQRPSVEIVCLTANMLRALVHLGYADDPRITEGYERLIERVRDHHGVPCLVLDHLLQTSCKMTIPQTLRALAAAPATVPRRPLEQARDTLVDDLLSIRVYHYVRPDFKQFKAAVKKRPKDRKVRDVKERWLADHKVSLDQLQPKTQWLRFGFPNGYNPDLLEAMLALAEVNAPHSPVLDEPLDEIDNARTADGRWKMRQSLNGKTLAAVERKGAASKWITYRALRVLRHFDRFTP